MSSSTRREAPTIECASGCGRTAKTWHAYWTCRPCRTAAMEKSPESWRDVRRRLTPLRCVIDESAGADQARLTGTPEQADDHA